MGLRTASVRRSDAEVMAPALTDTVQSQNFNLSSKNPASPLNNFETNKYSPTLAKRALNTDDLSLLENIEPVNLDSKKPILEECSEKVNSASDNNTSSQNMSVSSSPMGDREDKMGLEKTLLNSTLEPNVEDIMQQVIKSIETSEQLNNSSDLNEVLDLNIDKDLLEQVDNIINISMDDNHDDLETAHKIKENQASLILADLQKKHARIERRLDFLRRRCYKLESKLMGEHISGEVAGVFEQVHRSIKKSESSQDNEKHKPISATSVKMLVRKLEMASVLQANNAARQKNISKYFGSGSIEVSMFRNNVTGQVAIPQWSAEHKSELEKVAGQLQSQLHLVQDQLDSEATESSSGGESCDEFQTYNNPHQQYLSIQKRALWKYSTDRAAIASRWTWLQSQISDLEYRIRQHTEIHKQIRAEKGPVQLAELPENTQKPVEFHEHERTSPASDNTSTVNGYVGQLPGALGIKAENDKTDCQQCARTRPLVNFRKRRLLQVAGLHAVSKKAARPSTVRCSCVPCQEPCALCTGRVDPMHPRDPPETLVKAEKVALLDPGFHPVLSLPEDSSQNLHFEAIMKLHEWQQRSLRMKTMKVLQKRDQGESKSLEHRTKKLDHRKKYGRLKSSTMATLSEKIKNKIKRRKVGRPSGISKFKKRQSQLLLQNYDVAAEDAEVEAMIGEGSTPFLGAPQERNQLDSPHGSPLLQMQSISGYKQHNRNVRSDSYDIDNIVIPYSVAASTRVEKLQYKEILTPKWRIAETEPIYKLETKNNGTVTDLVEDSDVEDLTEEEVVARHDRCEQEEKKRFLSYLKLPAGYGRQRSHKRHDSVAENSRANTPDPPASPHPEGGAKSSDGMPALASPPPTPGAVLEEALPSIQAMLRRRTVSQSRAKEDPVPVDFVEQPPYEARLFPLSAPEYERMVQEMPDAHREIKTNFRAQDTGEYITEGNGAESADSESTESAIGDDAILEDEDEAFMEDEEEEDEDPNDPEWTDAEKSGHKDKHHRR